MLECAANCLKCDLKGAGLCDPGFCAAGYLNTATATSCVGKCVFSCWLINLRINYTNCPKTKVQNFV